MNKNLISLAMGIAVISLTTTSMAQLNLAFGGHLNEVFYLSAGSIDTQFTIKTPPTVTITAGGMKGGIAAGTNITTPQASPTTSQGVLWTSTSWPATSTGTISYTATVGSHGDISDSFPVTLDANGNITTSIASTIVWSADNNAACEFILTQPSAKGGPSYPTMTLDCGDASSMKVK
jgi:hypothetical protein